MGALTFAQDLDRLDPAPPRRGPTELEANMFRGRTSGGEVLFPYWFITGGRPMASYCRSSAYRVWEAIWRRPASASMVRVALSIRNGDCRPDDGHGRGLHRRPPPAVSPVPGRRSLGGARGAEEVTVVRRALDSTAGRVCDAIRDVRLALGLLGPRGWLVAAGAGLATAGRDRWSRSVW